MQSGFKKPFLQLYARIAFLSIHCQTQDKDLKEGHRHNKLMAKIDGVIKGRG